MCFIHVKSVEDVPKDFENNFQLTWQNFIPKIDLSTQETILTSLWI